MAPREVRAVEDALRASSRHGDYFDAALADAVLALGRAARQGCLSSDELVTGLRAVVFGTLMPGRPTAVADAVNVFLWRYARRGYHGDAPVRRVVDVDVAGPADRGDPAAL
ncbi:MAG: hypothetical protein JO180_01835, partial [Gemmatirosa sp.]|nr:hypothetical protein [Gemmatirosa sp.]